MDKKEKPVKTMKDRLVGMLELPKEITLNLPLISIIGSEEIVIENYKGVIEYTRTCVRINTSCGVIKIAGNNLLLKQITVEAITVTGIVTKLEYVL